MKRFPEYIVHIITWIAGGFLIFYYDAVALTFFDNRSEMYLWSYIIGVLSNLVIFYCVSLYFLPQIFRKKKMRILFSVLTFLFFCFISICEGFGDYYIDLENNPSWKQEGINVFGIQYFDLNFIYNFFFLLSAIGYFFVKEWAKNEKLRHQLIEEKTQAKLAFLKSQVNPHFLFNTLNNLFSSSLTNNDTETANGIAKLSNLMRYMLYESDVKTINIEKEISYIRNYIELQRLRFSENDSIRISLDISGEMSKIEIEPLLFIPFIENAFKYGIRLNSDSYIDIQLFVLDSVLNFSIRNSIHKKAENQLENEGGIGLQNVKQRLELQYPNKYQLTINQLDAEFIVELNIEF